VAGVRGSSSAHPRCIRRRGEATRTVSSASSYPDARAATGAGVVHIVEADGSVSGSCFAVQINGGRSHSRSDGYVIDGSDSNRRQWAASTMPVIGIAHDLSRVSCTGLTSLSCDAAAAHDRGLGSRSNIRFSLHDPLPLRFRTCRNMLTAHSGGLQVERLRQCKGRVPPRVGMRRRRRAVGKDAC
jgi:hypothetical protein